MNRFTEDATGQEANPFQTYFRLFAEISKKIHANNRPADILACIVENATCVLKAKGSIFWILDTDRREIQTKISFGFDFRSLSLVDYPTLSTLFDPKAPGPIVITDARNDARIPDLERLGKHRINAVTGIYFDIMGPYRGLLAVYFTANRTLEDQELALLTALGEQGAIALEKALGYDREMLDLYGQIIRGLTLAIEARDPATHGHSLNVARLARATARQMGLSPHESDLIYHAAILHDIGKIGTRDQILGRLGRLNSRDMDAIRRHPELGAQILSPLVFLGDIAPLVRAHHELFDGTGYPEGLKGDKIPLGARIITVCDVFETMITGRPGRPETDPATALSGIKRGSGTRFDPGVVRAFFKMLKSRPEILGPARSADLGLDRVFRDMERLAGRNRIQEKLPSPFTSIF